MADRRRAFSRLSGNAFGGVVLLTAQFLLGMALNLFITLPRSHPGSNPNDYFSGSLQSVVWALGSGIWLLLIHVIVAVLISPMRSHWLSRPYVSGDGQPSSWPSSGWWAWSSQASTVPASSTSTTTSAQCSCPRASR